MQAMTLPLFQEGPEASVKLELLPSPHPADGSQPWSQIVDDSPNVFVLDLSQFSGRLLVHRTPSLLVPLQRAVVAPVNPFASSRSRGGASKQPPGQYRAAPLPFAMRGQLQNRVRQAQAADVPPEDSADSPSREYRKRHRCDDPDSETKKPRRFQRRRVCEVPNCGKQARSGSQFCKGHGGGQRCQQDGCDRCAADGYLLCVSHGGGRRCQTDGCPKSAVSATLFCVSHGGGLRCKKEGCNNAARDRTNPLCLRHGGGARCKKPGCGKSARGSIGFCISHGGGVRCQSDGCNKAALSAAFPNCLQHDGGYVCNTDGCPNKARFRGMCPQHGGPSACKALGCGKKAQDGKEGFCATHYPKSTCKQSGCKRALKRGSLYCELHHSKATGAGRGKSKVRASRSCATDAADLGSSEAGKSKGRTSVQKAPTAGEQEGDQEKQVDAGNNEDFDKPAAVDGMAELHGDDNNQTGADDENNSSLVGGVEVANATDI